MGTEQAACATAKIRALDAGAADRDVTVQHGRAPGARPGGHSQRRDPAATQATEVSVVTADERRWLWPNHRNGFGAKMGAIGNKR
ncbi:hypothetical protein OG753_07475 [Streptomyces sp. NBC_00029]|uniref:hypothetical protein n=1 Tax=Streptomyces sp. NBC_00029 TaxID=2903613 RepID=UPI00324CFCF5